MRQLFQCSALNLTFYPFLLNPCMICPNWVVWMGKDTFVYINALYVLSVYYLSLSPLYQSSIYNVCLSTYLPMVFIYNSCLSVYSSIHSFISPSSLLYVCPFV